MSHPETHEPGWCVKPFAELSAHELHDILKLRVDVFVVEQECVYTEIDGQDIHAHHLMARAATGDLVAYARILPPHEGGLPHIGRVVVAAQNRGGQLGRRLMQEALKGVHALFGSTDNALAAQAYLVPFYTSLGYRKLGEAYDWDGILHVDMELRSA